MFGIATTATKPPAAAARVPESRSSLCSWPGRAQVHVRVDEAGEQVAALAVEHLGAVGRLERAGRAELGDLAAADEHVVRARRCPARGSSTWAPRISRSAGGCSRCDERLVRWRAVGLAASCAAAAGSAVGRGAPGEQLVEDRHADDDAGRDLLADHGLRRVDHLGGELDAAVDRAGVHEHLARAEAAAVDLVDARRTRAATGTKESVMRSCCIRSA